MCSFLSLNFTHNYVNQLRFMQWSIYVCILRAVGAGAAGAAAAGPMFDRRIRIHVWRKGHYAIMERSRTATPNFGAMAEPCQAV